MEFQNERVKCNDRSNGFYLTKKRGKWSAAEFTDNGWRVDWSGWFKNDSDFEAINENGEILDKEI